MSTAVVKTQAELDAALADADVDWIEIRSEPGVWLTVRAYGSATVRAYGSATVRATGSATVTATGSATVRATGSATVTATDSATVRATGSATVTAASKVAVHLHSGYAKVAGGVLIDHTASLDDPHDWADYHGVQVDDDGVATLYKAVRDNWLSSWGTSHEPGSTPEAPDWRDNGVCGHGLHFSPTPSQALAYDSHATRFLAVGVDIATLRPLNGGAAKCKAPRVVRACVEVDIDGNEVAS
jgi:hypothetical protein